MPTRVTVERVGPDDWRDLKDVRLRALAESPSAFGSTLAREVAFDDDTWHERAAQGRTLLARGAGPSGAVVGIAAVFPSHDDQGAAELVSVWVDPAARGGGVASALLRAAAELAAELGAERLALWVTTSNVAARTLYERAGFAATGDTKPLPSDPRLDEQRMMRRLHAPAGG